jgi:hypothetical protein
LVELIARDLAAIKDEREVKHCQSPLPLSRQGCVVAPPRVRRGYPVIGSDVGLHCAISGGSFRHRATASHMPDGPGGVGGYVKLRYLERFAAVSRGRPAACPAPH